MKLVYCSCSRVENRYSGEVNRKIIIIINMKMILLYSIVAN